MALSYTYKALYVFEQDLGREDIIILQQLA